MNVTLLIFIFAELITAGVVLGTIFTIKKLDVLGSNNKFQEIKEDKDTKEKDVNKNLEELLERNW